MYDTGINIIRCANGFIVCVPFIVKQRSIQDASIEEYRDILNNAVRGKITGNYEDMSNEDISSVMIEDKFPAQTNQYIFKDWSEVIDFLKSFIK